MAFAWRSVLFYGIYLAFALFFIYIAFASCRSVYSGILQLEAYALFFNGILLLVHPCYGKILFLMAFASGPSLLW